MVFQTARSISKKGNGSKIIIRERNIVRIILFSAVENQKRLKRFSNEQVTTYLSCQTIFVSKEKMHSSAHFFRSKPIPSEITCSADSPWTWLIRSCMWRRGPWSTVQGWSRRRCCSNRRGEEPWKGRRCQLEENKK